MTPAEFEAILSGYWLTFDSSLRTAAVESARFPPLVEIYWRLVTSDRPPEQFAFVEAIMQAVPDLPTGAVIYRAQKAYPAFVREHHAELVLTERFRWVFKSPRRDFDGIDLLVIREDRLAVGLELSTATPGAAAWAGVKARRHTYSAPFPVVALYATPEYRVGQFWLHAPCDLIAAVENVVEAAP